MKRNSWSDYQKQIADDKYYYARSCIRQNLLPREREGDARTCCATTWGATSSTTRCTPRARASATIRTSCRSETIMTVVARQFALMHEAGYEHFISSCITSFGVYTEVLATWAEFPETEERTREYLL